MLTASSVVNRSVNETFMSDTPYCDFSRREWADYKTAAAPRNSARYSSARAPRPDSALASPRRPRRRGPGRQPSRRHRQRSRVAPALAARSQPSLVLPRHRAHRPPRGPHRPAGGGPAVGRSPRLPCRGRPAGDLPGGPDRRGGDRGAGGANGRAHARRRTPAGAFGLPPRPPAALGRGGGARAAGVRGLGLDPRAAGRGGRAVPSDPRRRAGGRHPLLSPSVAERRGPARSRSAPRPVGTARGGGGLGAGARAAGADRRQGRERSRDGTGAEGACPCGADPLGYFEARRMNSSVLGSTTTRSPDSMNSGTRIVRPLVSDASLRFFPLAVSPLDPAAAMSTTASTYCGSVMPATEPFQ